MNVYEFDTMPDIRPKILQKDGGLTGWRTSRLILDVGRDRGIQQPATIILNIESVQNN
ncbi:hypothetical protein H8E88_23240 [candidate division KSB1 bacterium]|nr:hypothetical protein [candidate division KSB1 bacterium]